MNKTEAKKRVHRLFGQGEKLNAIIMAKNAKLKPDDWPVGMAAHIAGLSPAAIARMERETK